ncbi:MAG: hypothetical protein N3A71_04015 [Candidatus Dojkabacteria bacterium]|nr:hypothetical protein [Candidatus Dojkabacteria bacterium]
MQKSGIYSSKYKEEFSAKLLPDAEIILNVYKILRNLVKSDNLQTAIMQMESYVFDTDQFELKFTHQFGKKDVYNFEIEVGDLDLDPRNIATELGLEVDLPEDTPEFWKNWNDAVNLCADQLSDEELIEIFRSYV